MEYYRNPHGVLPGRSKVVKRWPVRGYEKAGHHWFNTHDSTTTLLSLKLKE